MIHPPVYQVTKKEEHQELHILTPFSAIFFTAHQLFLLRNQPQTKGSCYINSWIRQESLEEINSIFFPISELNPRAWQRFSCDNSSSPLKCFIKSQKDSISPRSSPLERCHWSREVKFSLENSWTHPANTSSPPALLQVCPNSTPKSFIPQEFSFYFFTAK